MIKITFDHRAWNRFKIRTLRKLFPGMAKRHDARAREWYQQQIRRTPGMDAVRKGETAISESTVLLFTPQEVNHDDGPWHTGALKEAKRIRTQAEKIESDFMHDSGIFYGVN